MVSRLPPDWSRAASWSFTPGDQFYLRAQFAWCGPGLRDICHCFQPPHAHIEGRVVAHFGESCSDIQTISIKCVNCTSSEDNRTSPHGSTTDVGVGTLRPQTGHWFKMEPPPRHHLNSTPPPPPAPAALMDG